MTTIASGQQEEFRFSGATYDHERDSTRLKTQLQRVHQFMLSGAWHTLSSIKMSCGGTEASVSARLRDLRKYRFGAHNVQHRRIAGGLWEYRMLAPSPCSCPITESIHEQTSSTHRGS